MKGSEEDPLVAARRAQRQAVELRERSHHVVIAADETVARLLAGEPAGQLSRLRAELQGLRHAMATRAVIEQAKGVLIATTGCDPEAAFDLLRQQSQHENRKVHDVAAELVARHMRPTARRHTPPRPARPEA